MDIKYFCPVWGFRDMSIDKFADKVKEAGYDGIEMDVLAENKGREHVLNVLKERNLELIAQHWFTLDPDFHTHKTNYEANLKSLAEARPLFSNSHTGRDYFTFEQNLELIALAASIEIRTGVPVIHETHRSRFAFAAHITVPFLDAFPELRLKEKICSLSLVNSDRIPIQ